MKSLFRNFYFWAYQISAVATALMLTYVSLLAAYEPCYKIEDACTGMNMVKLVLNYSVLTVPLLLFLSWIPLIVYYAVFQKMVHHPEHEQQ